MLFITLPTGQANGKCHVNGRPCDFEIDGDEFRFRREGGERWNRRRIMRRAPNLLVTHYMCTGAPSGPPRPPGDGPHGGAA